MENPKDSLFTIGELARRVGVTVRTLQYYDKVGLLKSTLSEGGRRMYTREDILKLQQILFFKSFGFSLEEISDKLLKGGSSADLERVFTRQRDILLGQIDNLSKITGLLDTVIWEIKAGQEISLDRLITIMMLMKQENPYSFVIRYFGDEQLKAVSERFGAPEVYEHFMGNSKDVFAKLESLYREGADPAGDEGQELAARWWAMVSEFTAGDPNLLKPLLSAGMDIGNWPQETRAFQDAIMNFLGKALDIYLKNKGIQLLRMEVAHNE